MSAARDAPLAAGGVLSDAAKGAESDWTTRPMGGVISGRTLRIALALAALAVAGLLVVGVIAPWSVLGVLTVGLAIAAALFPGTALPLLLILAVVVYRVATPGAGLDGRLVVLVALLPLVHQLAGLAAVIPARSRVQLVALRPAVIRYLWATVPVVVLGAAYLTSVGALFS